MKILTLSLLTAALLLPSVRAEDTNAETDKVDERQDNQKDRIHQGVKSGELTKHEAQKLREQQKHVRKAERRAEADGTVSGKEAQRLGRMQNRASQQIYRQKHDRKKRR